MSIQNGIRESGLDIVGQIPWGTHFCNFYKTQEDLSDILVHYFRAGLESNEFCVWVTSEFLTKEEALRGLKKNVPQFSKYLKKGQIEIFPYTDWYLKQGKFEMNRVLNMWLAKYKEGLKKGYDGIRVSGNPFWLESKKDWDDFSQYEASIDNAIGPSKILVLCTYFLDKCSGEEIIDVVKNHQFALIKRNEWELIKSVEQKKVEAKLEASEKRFNSTLDNLLEGAMIIDSRFKYLYVNNALARQGRTSKEMLLGKTMMEFYPGIRKTEVFRRFKDCMEKRTAEVFETEFVFPNGETGWFEVSVQPVPEGLFILSADITEKKSAEDERRKLDQLKDDFLGIAGHELKTPLTSIKAYTQVLYKIFSQKKDKTAQMISKMDNQVDRMILMIRDFLDITKIKEGKIKFNMKTFNFSAMVKEAVDEVQSISGEYKIQKRLPESLAVFGNRERLEQVVVNFLTNAVKYSPEKSRIIVKAKISAEYLDFSVRDFGKGVPEGTEKKIFERFFRAEEGRKNVNGLGLGLYISSEIIRRHKGEIGVRSASSKGSVFYFKIPLKSKKVK